MSKYLSKLREDKAPGTDNLSPRLLIAVSGQIVLPLTVIFNKSLADGTVPED